MTNVVLLSEDQFNEMTDNFITRMKEEIIPIINSVITNKNTEAQELVTRKEVCILLRISEPTLWVLTKSGKLPFIKIGRRVLFDRQQILDFLKNN